jgi:hexokinase
MAEASPVDDILKVFDVSKEDLEMLSSIMESEFKEGLSKHDHKSCIKMLITYVHSLPDGTESGDFLALDLGGSNFRVLLISIKDGKDTQIVKKSVLSKELITQTQEVLFDHIASEVATFIKEQNIKETLPLGFTFSFPVEQSSLIAGKLLRWTKDFDAKGAVGEDVVQLLQQAFARRGDVKVDVVALVNDTTGTQMALGHSDPDCYVGIILGTGTNACFLEDLDKVPKFDGDRSKYKKVIINTEWGAMGENGLIDKFITRFDEALDQFSANKKQQPYEKMISGKYLGEVVRQVCLELIEKRLLFGGKSSEEFKTREKFLSDYVSTIEKGDGSDVSAIREILVKLGVQPTDDDCRLVRRVCAAVSTRGARLAAAGIVTVVRRIGKVKKCTVAVDGSLYKYHPRFKFVMDAAMEEIEPGNGIKMKESTDGSGRGAAIIAAVANRLTKK